MQNVLLIGSGRVARHLRHWNSLQVQPLSLTYWNRKEHSSEQLRLNLEKVALVWLAISDIALVPFYQEHFVGKKVVHFSGALNDERMISAHPLMSFPIEVMQDAVYPQIHFTLTGVSHLDDALPGFKNSFSHLPAQDKPLYHALCVTAGNFPQFLWNESLKELQKLRIPDHAFETYITQVTANFNRDQERALTGPLVRKDFKTVEQNSTALKNSKLQKIYNAFTEVFK